MYLTKISSRGRRKNIASREISKPRMPKRTSWWLLIHTWGLFGEFFSVDSGGCVLSNKKKSFMYSRAKKLIIQREERNPTSKVIWWRCEWEVCSVITARSSTVRWKIDWATREPKKVHKDPSSQLAAAAVCFSSSRLPPRLIWNVD